MSLVSHFMQFKKKKSVFNEIDKSFQKYKIKIKNPNFKIKKYQ